MVRGVKISGISGGFSILSDFREFIAELLWSLWTLLLIHVYHIAAILKVGYVRTCDRLTVVDTEQIKDKEEENLSNKLIFVIKIN